MSELTLVIGNYNLSSWSFRPWMALKHLSVPFNELVIDLDQPTTASEIQKHSASGKVPVLKLGNGTQIWDSLAICEYVAEEYGKRLWPSDSIARALARSASAEMHSGFQALRKQCPFNAVLRTTLTLDAAVLADVARIQTLWTECRARFGKAGPYLFGNFSLADVMFAPVVSRFVSYSVPVEGVAKEYRETIRAMPVYRAWMEAAEKSVSGASR